MNERERLFGAAVSPGKQHDPGPPDLFTVVTTAAGRSFSVRLVRKGDAYGLNRCLVHEDARPMVEFFDRTYLDRNGFDPLGQFVTRYYLSSLLEGTCVHHGLTLNFGVPAWSLCASSAREAVRWASLEALRA